MAPAKAKFMDVLDVLSSSDSEPDDPRPAGAASTAGSGGNAGPSTAAPGPATAAEAKAATAAGGSSSGSSSDDEDCDGLLPAAAVKRRKAEVTLEQLQRAGYRSGPSVLLVRPQADEGQQNWEWSSGREAKEVEPQEESLEDRRRTEEAVTVGVEGSMDFSMKAMKQVEALREEARAERARLAAEKKLTFQQKEKRKRDSGQASRGKNFVEEEKRMQRQYKMYSGFD